MKTIEMKLKNQPFLKILNGIKTIELRLFDEKRQQIEIGDEIVFTNTEDENQKILISVIGLSTFRNFKDLLENLDPVKCGWDRVTDVSQMAKQMRQYYSLEEENKYGVLGIHIKLK